MSVKVFDKTDQKITRVQLAKAVARLNTTRMVGGSRLEPDARS